jgi:4-hydroxybenzoyl-CoA thioesterase
LGSFVFRRRLTVEFGHCDPAGMLFIPRAYQYFDTSTWMMFEAALGLAPQDFNARIGILPLVDVNADCRTHVRFGDTIDIASRVTEFRRSSFHVGHTITRDGEVAIEGGETRVWAVRDKDDPTKISARPIPDDVIARFA